jgi:beta-lactamase regulating signal transducer with metallopeptidase domain
MSWLPLQTVAQISVEHILNALPEGFLIALFAWALLRVLRRQNSGTRFAVWFLALLTVAAFPVLGGFGEGRALAAGMSSGSARPAITIPGRWALFVFLAWALGAGAAMVRLATGLWRLRRLRRSCTAIVAADLDPAVRKTVDAIGARSVTIATSECVRVPAAIGFSKRTIVLPAWALRELPPNDLNVILLHEFAHLRRWDDWTNLIQKIVRVLFFFHPAVWWIENRLSVEREMACDDAVLAETANPHGYASCLVSLLEKSLAHRGWSMAQAAVHRAREASLRLAQILDKNRPVATRVWKPALGMVGAFSMICLMALPHAPQFVAFDRGMMASNSDHGYSAAVSESSLRPSFQFPLPTTAVIPAALRTGESSSVGTTAKVVHTRAVAGHRPAPASVVATRFNAAPPRDRVVAISASANQEIVPQFRTLVFY